MTEAQRLKEFERRVEAAMKELNIPALVMSVRLDDERLAGLWMPGCSATCAAPHLCASEAFEAAALHMTETAYDLKAEQAEKEQFAN